MKNGLGESAVERIACALKQVKPDFDTANFVSEAMSGLQTLELKGRVYHVIATLHKFLPGDFAQTARLLKRLPNVWDYGDPDDPLRSFAAWPVIDYVGVYGLAHPHTALAVLKQLTSLFSAEFAIRPYLIAHPEYCQSQLAKWAYDEDEHIRRLVSEGSRPRLPWGMQLKPYVKDPSPSLPLLEILKNDSSLYVRRSVANHLNDIAKDHPDLVIAICRRWYPEASPELRWVIKHATRSLVKAGHPDVFPLLGYSDSIELATPTLQLSKDLVQLGGSLEFQLDLKSAASCHQKIVVDFAIHFVKANGERKPKVFKLKSIALAPEESCQLVKAHAIKAITTRKYYPGIQLLEILVNGKSLISREFTLITD